MQELEAKFLAAPGSDSAAALRRLQQSLAWAGYRIQPSGRRRVIDTYFDTDDQQLRSAGWSYRRRQQNGKVTVTLKELNRSRAAVFDREEIEQPLIGDQADALQPPAGPVQARLAALLQPEAKLAALFTLDNDRTRFRLTHSDHPRAVIEMAYDLARLGASAPLAFTEVEFELTSGPHELLAAVLNVLELEPDFTPARLSKFQRGLMAAGCPLERQRASLARHLDRRSRWLDVAVTHLKSLFQQIKLYEPYAWEGVHPEGVHQMRVATRRARAALNAFSDVLPVAEAGRLARELRWLAGRLGAVRDLDVHIDHADVYRQRARPAEQAALDRYIRHLAGQHRQARACLLDTLDNDAYLAVVSSFRALLTAAGRPENAVPLPVEEAARATVTPLLDDVFRRGRAIHDKSPARHLHRLRIKVKRLRYQLEFLDDAYDGSLAGPVDALRRLQDHLGVHQDAVVARGELADYVDRQASGKRSRKLFARLMRYEKRRARKARARYAKDWQRFEQAAETLALTL